MKLSSPETYPTWFSTHAHRMVLIAGGTFPCVKITKSKAALSDGTLFTTSSQNKLEFQQNAVKHTSGSRIASIYKTLSPVDKVSVSDFLEALERKTRIQSETEKATEMDPSKACCSFCGKKADDVKKMIAGPGGVYLCDECINICNDILKGDEETN